VLHLILFFLVHMFFEFKKSYIQRILYFQYPMKYEKLPLVKNQ